MAAAETAGAGKAAKAKTTRFLSDDQGRVLFYPCGPRATGYIVDSPTRERALRAAAARYDRWFAPLLALPALATFYGLVSLHPLLAFGLIAAVLPVFQLVEGLISRIVFGSLVRGLERVAARRPAWTIPVVLAGMSAAAWVILELYDSRLAALPRGDAISVFYGDFAWGLIDMLVGGLITLVLLQLPTSHFNNLRSYLALLVFGAMTLGGAWWVLFAYVDPKPVVTVTPGVLYCGWDVAWLEMSDISLKTDRGYHSRFGGAWAEVALEPGSSAESRASEAGLREPLTCRIDSLNVGYEEIYQAIRDAWVARRQVAK